MNPSVVQPSSIGSSVAPTLRIWKKWSMTQIESNPASSASRTIRPSVGPMASGPPGHVNEGIWSPSFTGRSVRDVGDRCRQGRGWSCGKPLPLRGPSRPSEPRSPSPESHLVTGDHDEHDAAAPEIEPIGRSGAPADERVRNIPKAVRLGEWCRWRIVERERSRRRRDARCRDRLRIEFHDLVEDEAVAAALAEVGPALLGSGVVEMAHDDDRHRRVVLTVDVWKVEAFGQCLLDERRQCRTVGRLVASATARVRHRPDRLVSLGDPEFAVTAKDRELARRRLGDNARVPEPQVGPEPAQGDPLAADPASRPEVQQLAD